MRVLHDPVRRTLRFADGHPKELAVRGPDDTWFFLVYEPSDALSPGLEPLTKLLLELFAGFAGLLESRVDRATVISDRGTRRARIHEPGKCLHFFDPAVQGRTTVTRPVSFIGFRELMSARGHALLQLFLPVQHHRERR
jgi:hypothetical protein